MRLEIVQLKINLNKEVQANETLTEKLNGNGVQIKQLEQTLHNHKITCTTLQAENKKLKQELYEIVCHHSGQNVEKVGEDFQRDYWMTAIEAKEYGLVDEVLLVNPKKDIKAESK